MSMRWILYCHFIKVLLILLMVIIKYIVDIMQQNNFHCCLRMLHINT